MNVRRKVFVPGANGNYNRERLSITVPRHLQGRITRSMSNSDRNEENGEREHDHGYNRRDGNVRRGGGSGGGGERGGRNFVNRRFQKPNITSAHTTTENRINSNVRTNIRSII